MGQFLRPSSDISTTSWNGAYTDIDEVTASDGDFGYSDDNVDGTYEFAFPTSGIVDPTVSTLHVVKCRVSRSDGGVPNNNSGSAASLEILLMQGGTTIATVRANATVGLWEDVSYTLTGTQANNISDYNNLRLRFNYLGGGGSPANRRGVAVSWAEMEIPFSEALVGTTTTSSSTDGELIDKLGPIFGQTTAPAISQLLQNGQVGLTSTTQKRGVKIIGFNNQIGDFSVNLDQVTNITVPVNITAEIWSVIGGDLPGSLLETSNTSISTSTIPATEEWYKFKFDGNHYNQDIVIVIAATIASGQLGFWRYTGAIPDQNGIIYQSGTWINQSSELTYIINEDIIVATTSGFLTSTAFIEGVSNGVASLDGLISNKVLIEGEINTATSIVALLTEFKIYLNSFGRSSNSGTLTEKEILNDLIGEINASSVLSYTPSIYGIISGFSSTEAGLNNDAQSLMLGVSNNLTTTSLSLASAWIEGGVKSRIARTILTGRLKETIQISGKSRINSVGNLDGYRGKELQVLAYPINSDYDQSLAYKGLYPYPDKDHWFRIKWIPQGDTGGNHVLMSCHNGSRGYLVQGNGQNLLIVYSQYNSLIFSFDINISFKRFQVNTFEMFYDSKIMGITEILVNGKTRINFPKRVFPPVGNYPFGLYNTNHTVGLVSGGYTQPDGNNADPRNHYGIIDIEFEYENGAVKGHAFSKKWEQNLLTYDFESISDGFAPITDSSFQPMRPYVISGLALHDDPLIDGFNLGAYTSFRFQSQTFEKIAVKGVRVVLWRIGDPDYNLQVIIQSGDRNHLDVLASSAKIHSSTIPLTETEIFIPISYGPEPGPTFLTRYFFFNIEDHVSSDMGNKIAVRQAENGNTITTQRSFLTSSYSTYNSGSVNGSLAFVIEQNTTTGLLSLPTGNMLSVQTCNSTLAGILTSGAIDEALVGESNGSTSTVSILNAKGSLGGSIDGATTTTTVLTTSGTIGDLEGVINGVATITSILTAKGILQGIINTNSAVNGTASARGGLVISIDGITTTSGTLSANGQLAGSSNGIATNSGLLNSNLQGEVVVNTDSMTIGVLTGSGALLGESNGIATTNALVGSTQPITGTINGTSTVTGILTSKGELVGIINGTTSVSAILNGLGVSDGASTGTASTSGTLLAKGSLNGVINTSTTILGSIVSGSISGTINGSTTTFGILNSTLFGSVVVNGVGMATATLTGRATLIGIIDNSLVVNGHFTGNSVRWQGDTTYWDRIDDFGGAIRISKTTVNARLTQINVGFIAGAWYKLSYTVHENNDTAVLNYYNGLSYVSCPRTVGNHEVIYQRQANESLAILRNNSNNTSIVVDSFFQQTLDIGTLSSKGSLNGVINSSTTTTSELNAKGSLAGISSGQTSLVGSLGSGAMAGTTNGSATTQGDLSAKGLLEGIIITATTTSGTLIGTAVLLGVTNGVATTQGILNSTLLGSVIVNGVGMTSGTLTGSGILEGISNGSSSTDGDLTVSGSIGSLSGTINSSTTVTGALTSIGLLSGVSNGSTTTTSLLVGKGTLIGDSNGSTSTNGAFVLGEDLIGVSNGSTSIVGVTLTGSGSLAGVSEPLPDFVDLAEGSLIAKFFTDDESYGETINTKGKGVVYIDFFMGKIASPDFEMRGEIWQLDGSGLPLTLLQISNNTIEATTVPAGPTYQRFTFDVIQNFYGYIAIVVHIIDHTVGDESNYIERFYGNSNHFKKGQIVYNFDGLAWSTEPTQDINGVIQLKKFTRIVGSSYGQANGNATVIGSLTGSGALLGEINGTSSATVTFDMLAGVSNGQTITSGNLSGIAQLAGVSNGTSIASATISNQALVGVATNITGVASVIGTLTSNGPLEGIINSVTTTSGEAYLKGLLFGISNGSSTAIASLQSNGALVGSINGSSEVTAYFNQIEGESESYPTVEGILIGIGGLSGVINGTTTTSIVHPTPPNYNTYGFTNGKSTVTGTLTKVKTEPLDSTCFEIVKYIDKGPYQVVYKTNSNRVVYLSKKYIVNYNCKKFRK